MRIPGGPRTWTLAAGALWGACWLPWLPAYLFPVVFAVVLLSLARARTGAEAARLGVLYDIAAYGVSGHFLWALTRFSPFGAAFYFVMIGYFLPFAVAATWGAFRIERATGLPRGGAYALLYVGLEGCRTLTDLSFPADVLAHAFGDLPSWIAWTPWVGPHGVTAWALGVALLLARAVDTPAGRRARAATFGAAVLLWVLPWAASPLAPGPASDAPPLRFGIVQPKVAVTEKFDRARRPEIRRRLESLSAAVARDVDLLVWPESSRPGAVRWDAEFPFRDPAMESLAASLGTPILYGCEIARFRGDRFEALYNGAAIAYPDGRPGDWYGKQRLLPFAEGVPFGDLFGWDPFADGAKGEDDGVLTMLGKFSAGPRPTLFEVAGARIGVLICYEGMYPRLSARYRRDGADALAILTNDLWWGRSAFPRWHANQAASVARTLEVPVLRAANAGISGAYAPDGTAVAETALLEATSAIVEVPRASGRTPWAATIGTWLPWAAFALLALLAAVARARRARHQT